MEKRNADFPFSLHLTFSILFMVLIFSGCGKHEERGAVGGVITGGAIGNVVTGGKSKGLGTLVGATLGGIIGSEMGRDTDEEIAEEKAGRAKVVIVRSNPQPGTWCISCHRNVTISGARRCPDCGDILVHDKICSICRETFSPRSSTRYCPYCPERSKLVWR